MGEGGILSRKFHGEGGVKSILICKTINSQPFTTCVPPNQTFFQNCTTTYKIAPKFYPLKIKMGLFWEGFEMLRTTYNLSTYFELIKHFFYLSRLEFFFVVCNWVGEKNAAHKSRSSKHFIEMKTSHGQIV